MTDINPDFDFPLLDSARTGANADLFRVVIGEHGIIEPTIDETDSYCTMPLRLSHNAAAGVIIEIGPYDLDHNDIDRLRELLRAYDTCVNGGTTLRRIK